MFSPDGTLISASAAPHCGKGKRKGPKTKTLQVHKLLDPRVKSNLRAMLEERLHCVTAVDPEELWKQMKTILQETTAEVVGLSTRKHQDSFDESDKEFQELLEKKRSCHNHLLAKPMIKLPSLNTRLPAVHSRLSLGPCRMIGGQDLPLGHNRMLTRVTCASSTRH